MNVSLMPSLEQFVRVLHQSMNPELRLNPKRGDPKRGNPKRGRTRGGSR